MRRPEAYAVCGVLACLAFLPTSSRSESADPEESEARQALKEALRRETPSGLYQDPASFFRFHGYVRAGLVEAGEELGIESDRTPQILVSGLSERTGENESGFVSDAALFVGGEPLDNVSGVLELHFVGNAIDPVLTEAKITWDFLPESQPGPVALRLIGGRYWWPFGNHNAEWFSVLNPFSVVSPAASEVVPAHFNELGLMLEGEAVLGRDFGINFLLSVGNGVSSFALDDNVRDNAFDTNGDRTLTTRVGFAWKRDFELELGASWADGDLRTTLDSSIPESDARRFPGSFEAQGLDLAFERGDLGVRLYAYESEERLVQAPVSAIDRAGVTAEVNYAFHFGEHRLLRLHGRFSSANEERLDGGENRYEQLAAGIEYQVAPSSRMFLTYALQEESRDAPERDDDVFNFSIVFEF